MAQVLETMVSHLGDTDAVPGFWLWNGPAVAIWGVNYQVENLCLSLPPPLCISNIFEEFLELKSTLCKIKIVIEAKRIKQELLNSKTDYIKMQSKE